jgi:hypothetical protein
MMYQIQRPDDLSGAADFTAEVGFARRARQRRLNATPNAQCRRRFTHPRQPTRFDERGFLVIDICECILPSAHDDGCVCEHDIERRVYRVEDNGREHYVTRPLVGGAGTTGASASRIK